MAEAAGRGLAGVSLTDHNGLWGLEEAQTAAAEHDLVFVSGIEVTALYGAADVHILGYSRNFAAKTLRAGLATTRAGYRTRVEEMVERCHAAGYPQVSFADIVADRAKQADPCYVSYDVARKLTEHGGLTLEQARQLTVRGGACYVPYSSWTLSPAAVVALLHEAHGIAVLAHPGTVAYETGQDTLDELIDGLVEAGLDGIEVHHPFHDRALVAVLLERIRRDNLLVTGGSDWHGPGRFHKGYFGRSGIDETQFRVLAERLEEVQ